MQQVRERLFQITDRRLIASHPASGSLPTITRIWIAVFGQLPLESGEAIVGVWPESHLI
jgi:hypothetical protein